MSETHHISQSETHHSNQSDDILISPTFEDDKDVLSSPEKAIPFYGGSDLTSTPKKSYHLNLTISSISQSDMELGILI